MSPDDPRRPPTDDPAAGPPRPRDELASALLDGELTPAEADAARDLPDVVARAAEMEAVRAVIRAAPSPDVAARDRAVAAALAAYDASAASTAHAPGSGAAAADHQAVTELAAHRRHRGGALRRRPPRWLGAAAIAAVVLAGAASLAVFSSGDGADDDASGSAATLEAAPSSRPPGEGDRAAADGDGTADERAADAQSGEAGETTTFDQTTTELGDLGAFLSADELVDGLRPVTSGADDAEAAAPRAESTTSADVLGRLRASCPAAGLPAPLVDPAVTPRLHGDAVVDGRDVEVWVIDTAVGTRIVALDACTVVVDRAAG
jgi:hypothetical protein